MTQFSLKQKTEDQVSESGAAFKGNVFLRTNCTWLIYLER